MTGTADLENVVRRLNCKVCTIQKGIDEGGGVGESAYQIAVDNGFVGTEEEWLASLQGPPGPQGAPGSNGEIAEPTFSNTQFTI